MNEFSIFQIFISASFFVQLIIILLVIMSVISWAVAVNKFFIFKNQIKKSSIFENLFYSSKLNKDFLNNIKKEHGIAIINLFFSGLDTLIMISKQNTQPCDIGSIKTELIQKMNFKMKIEISLLESKLDWLANISSTAPFIGLLGTVWGIMGTFSAFAGAKTITIAVLAPQISEALLATAIGLFVAIPALVFYNKLNVLLLEISSKLENASNQFSVLFVSKKFFNTELKGMCNV